MAESSYPIIAKIKSDFNKIKISNLFGNDTCLHRYVIIPLTDLEYVNKHKDTELEKFYIKIVLDQLKLNEIKIICDLIAIFYEKYDIKGDIIFSGKLKPNAIYNPYLLEYEEYSVNKKIHLSSNIEFIEYGLIDLDTGNSSNIKHYLKLDVSFDLGDEDEF